MSETEAVTITTLAEPGTSRPATADRGASWPASPRAQETLCRDPQADIQHHDPGNTNQGRAGHYPGGIAQFTDGAHCKQQQRNHLRRSEFGLPIH